MLQGGETETNSNLFDVTTDCLKSTVLSNSSDSPILALNVYGESVSNGIPTTTNPIEIVSLTNPTLTINGVSVEIPYTLRGMKDDEGNWIARDEIIVSDGAVKFIQRIDKKVFMGTENWKYKAYTSYAMFWVSMSNYVKRSDISSRYQHSYNIKSVGQCSLSDMMYFADSVELNLDTFKQQLQRWNTDGNPLYIHYAFATPVEEDITNTECGQVLLALRTYNPTTTITCDADFVLKYRADIANTFNNIEESINEKTENIYGNFKEYAFNSPYTTTNYNDKLTEYSELFANSGKSEAFMFFTDPHLAEAQNWEKGFVDYITELTKVYNSTPTSFCVCGGDWLGNSDTVGEACFKLGYIDGVLNSLINNYYHVVGNHDFNYTGKLNASSADGTETLSNQCINNLWYRKYDNNYYKFNGKISDYFVLDTQSAPHSETSAYMTKQFLWLANELKDSEFEHHAIFMHIVYNGYSDMTINTKANKLAEIIEAYNNKSSIVIGTETIDFTNCNGRVDYVMGGHCHKDVNIELGGVPFITTTHTRDGKTPTFDLCLVDYDNNMIKLVRIGTGENREINY